MKKIFTEADGLTPTDMVHSGLDHFDAARVLFDLNCPGYYDSAGYLLHMAAELLLKAWLLEVKREYERTHDLLILFEGIPKGPGRPSLDVDEMKAFKLLNSYERLRYPDRSNPTEIGTDDLEQIQKLIDKLIENLPDSIRDVPSSLDIVTKGGRVLMCKKL